MPTPQELKELQELEELERLEQESAQPEEQGMLSKAVDFATDLPYSAIEMIPGMKERRQEGLDQAELDAQSYEHFKNDPEVTQLQPLGEDPALIEKIIGKRIPESPEAVQRHQARNPNTGMQDPAYEYGLGFMGPESAASISNKLRNFLKPAAKRAEVAGKVKNVTELEPFVQGKVNEAAEMFNKKQISPRMLEQESRLSGGTASFNPEALRNISPELDQYVLSLPPSQSGSVHVPATDALKIRAMLNKTAGWKMHPTDPAKAVALDQKVAELHQQLAGKLESLDPAMRPLSEEMQKAYTLQKQVLGGSSKNPINAVIPSEGVTGLAKKGRLQSFDEQAGSELSQLGQDIRTAHERQAPMDLSDLLSITGPKRAAIKAMAPAMNVYDEMALKQLLAPQLSGTQKARAIGQKLSPLMGDDE